MKLSELIWLILSSEPDFIITGATNNVIRPDTLAGVYNLASEWNGSDKRISAAKLIRNHLKRNFMS